MPPNIVLVVLDTARADAVEAVRRARPDGALATLASEGVVYTNATATAPWTLPSHGSIFTGQYPSKHGAHGEHKYLPGDRPSLPEVLRSAGYETVGFTNNAWITGEFGFARGFEELRKIWQYVDADTNFGEMALTASGLDLFGGTLRAIASGNPLVNVLNAVYGKWFYRRHDFGAARTNELVKTWLTDRQRSDPFFLFLNYLEPHLPYDPTAELATNWLPEGETYDRVTEIDQDPWPVVAGQRRLEPRDAAALEGLHRAEIAYLDRQLATLFETLRNHTTWDDTVVVVCADHGENIGDHGLMDHQFSLHETVLRVPLLVSGGTFDGGRSVTEPVQLVDLFPTLLSVANMEEPPTSQGLSFHPMDSTDRETVIAEYHGGQPPVEELRREWNDVPSAVDRAATGLRAIRRGDWKLVRSGDGSVELFNLTEDPNEETDRSATTPDTVTSLESTLDEWHDSFTTPGTHRTPDVESTTEEHLQSLGYLQ